MADTDKVLMSISLKVSVMASLQGSCLLTVSSDLCHAVQSSAVAPEPRLQLRQVGRSGDGVKNSQSG